MPRFNSKGSYVEFTVLERGPDEYPDLSIKVDSSFDDMFIDNLKRSLRHGRERGWIPDQKLWFISPAVLDKTVDLAKSCFKSVIKIEGSQAIDVMTGEEIPMTMDLFG